MRSMYCEREAPGNHSFCAWLCQNAGRFNKNVRHGELTLLGLKKLNDG